MKKYQGSWGWVSFKALLGWRGLKNNCWCQRQSFPTSFRPSRDAKYTELEAVYLFFLSFFFFLFAWYCADSRDKIPKMPEILMTFHCKLWTLSAKLKFLCTLPAQAPCCCFFFIFPVYCVLGDSLPSTGQEGEPEHIPDPFAGSKY